MSTYVCNHAEWRTIEKGSNAGKNYAYATFVPEGTNVRNARTALGMSYFPPTVGVEEWEKAWQATIDNPNSPEGQFAINAANFRITEGIPVHAKKYTRDTEVAGVKIPKGGLRRINGDSKHVQMFDYVDIFAEVDADGKPYDDLNTIAQNIIKRNCVLWDQVPAEAKLIATTAQPASQPATQPAGNVDIDPATGKPRTW